MTTIYNRVDVEDHLVDHLMNTLDDYALTTIRHALSLYVSGFSDDELLNETNELNIHRGVSV